MANRDISNPLGALQKVSDFTTGLTADGELIAYEQVVETYRANAAVTKGYLVCMVVPTTTAALSVKHRTSSDITPLTVGVALESAAAGAPVRVCVRGHCQAYVGSATAAAGDYGIHDSTTGEIDPVSAAIDAAVITGNILGVFLGAKDSGNLAPFFMKQY